MASIAKGKAREGSQEATMRQMDELNLRLLEEFKTEDATAQSRGYTVTSTLDLRTMPEDKASYSAAQVANIFTTQPQGGPHLENVECILHSPVAKRELLEYPNYPQHTPHSLTNPYILDEDGREDEDGESPPYEIAEVSSKGLGMLATRDIPQGAFIMSERPLMIGPQEHYLNAYNVVFSASATTRQRQRAALTEAEKTFRVAFARMDPENQASYIALHNAHRSDGSGPLMGVMRTNAYEVCHLDGMLYTGIFKDLSRINHSCSPNTTSYFDRASLSKLLFAARDIPAGTEITSQYCGLLQPRAVRVQVLKPYGFRCTCAACTKPLESDTNCLRISRMKDAVPAIVKWAGNPALPGDLLLRPVLAMLEVIEAEGLEGSPAHIRALYHVVLMMQVLAVAKAPDVRLLVYALKWATLSWCRVEVDREQQAKFKKERKSVMASAMVRAGLAPGGEGKGQGVVQDNTE